MDVNFLCNFWESFYNYNFFKCFYGSFLAIMRFLLKKARLVFIFKKNILKTFWSRHLFLFYFKKENKIRKKNLNVTLDKKMCVWEKLSPISEVMFVKPKKKIEIL